MSKVSTEQQIFLLGHFQTEPVLKIPGRNAHRLLTYLLIWPKQKHTRNRLSAALWPEYTPSRGRRTLSDALYRLRQTLPDHWLDVTPDTLALMPRANLWVDLWAFQQLTQAAEPARLAEAAALYRGELAPEIEDDWIWQPREQIREQVTAVLLKLAKTAESNQQLAQAHSYYGRLAELDDMNEAAHRGQMRCLAGQNRLEQALSVYQEFTHHLARELSVPPAAATQQLAQQLQAEWELQERVRAQPTHVPFVGRLLERNHLLARLDEAMDGRGGLVTVLGEAGMGKTRLLESLAESANWRGWQVAWGTGEEFALPTPYAPLVTALSAALPRPRLQQLLRLVPSWWLSFIARLVPDLADQVALPMLPDSSPLEKELPSALNAALTGLQQVAPHLFILDDVQWADPAIWPLLTEMQAGLAKLSVLVVVSGRLTSLQSQPSAWEAIHTWEQSGAPVLHLGGLEPHTLADLAKATGRGVLSTPELAHLHRVSGGNPLLALGLLESAGPITAVSQLQLLDMQQQRLAVLDDATLIGLQAAAILGYRFDYALWEAVVTGISATDLPVLAGDLEQQRFLILEADGYRFPHDTLRASVYEAIPPARRTLLHQRALVACAEYQPAATQALLNHAWQGSVTTAVARYAHRAGQEALDRFAYQDAITYFTQVIELEAACTPPMLHAALVGRARAHTLLAAYDLLEKDLHRLEQLGEQLPDANYQIPVLKNRAEFAWNRGDQADARRLAETGLTLAQEAGDGTNEAAFLEMLARVARNQGDYRQAQTWISRAHDRYITTGNQIGQASTLDKLANLAYEDGKFEQSVTMHRRAAALFRRLGAVHYEARALSGVALALKSLGDFEQARQTHHQVLEIALALGDRHSEWTQLVLLGNVALELGDYETAVAWYLKALPVSRQMDNARSLTMTLHNLGEAYREMGDWEQSLAYYTEGLDINQAKGFERGEANNLNGIGLAHLGLQQHAAARQALIRAQALWQALGERFKLSETLAGLALVSLAEGAMSLAQDELSAALKLLAAPPVHPFWWRWAHFAAYQVYKALDEGETAVSYLCSAAQAMSEIVNKLPAVEQEGFLQRVSINRDIRQAVYAHADQQAVRLVKTTVRLGQPLTESDYITITWTLSLPTDANISSPVERRRHVLQRLLTEAEAQGAAPTDADLAQIVGVSRRTILRDMEALAAANITLPTRGRLA